MIKCSDPYLTACPPKKDPCKGLKGHLNLACLIFHAIVGEGRPPNQQILPLFMILQYRVQTNDENARNNINSASSKAD